MRLYTTNPLFAGNVQFYGRLGYQVDWEEPYKGSVTVYMSKQLHPASPQGRATLDDDPGTRPAMHIWTSHDGPEGPSLRKRTVRNENTGRIRAISGGNG